MTRDDNERVQPDHRSNWNEQRQPSDEDAMERLMGGRSMFDAEDDAYVEPGEASESRDELDAIMDQYLDQMTADVGTGKLISVPVVAIKSDHVLVDVGDKSEGIVDIREFPRIGDRPAVAVGDVIDVVVKGHDAESGLITLSHQEARRRKALQMVEDALRDHKPITGRATRTVKGGLILDIGTTAFLPASQIDLRRVENFDEWIGRELQCYVIEYTPEKRRIIVSRRKWLEEERDRLRRDLMDRLQPGELVEVTVKRLVEFGAFVDLGGVDGLIPRSEISWQRTLRPEDVLKVGDRLQVRVTEVNKTDGKITLSRRLAMANPWDTAVERFPKGSTVRGTVVSLTAYGAFVRLEEGLDGMIHISDMAWDAGNRKPSDYLAPGQQVEAMVLNVDPAARRISLGLKQLTRDPWADLAERYPKGARVRGKVTGLTKYGAFVELEPGIEGMVHVSDFSWDKRISQPRDVVQKGQELDVCVLSVDPERRRISLGVKQLTESPLEVFLHQYHTGDVVEGEVTNLTDFGAFLRLPGGVEGFIHVSQLAAERVKSPAECLKVGQTVAAKITKIDPASGKVSLSRRQLIKEQERNTIAAYMKSSKRDSGNMVALADLLGDIQLEDDLPPPERVAPPPSATESGGSPASTSPPADDGSPSETLPS